MSDTIQPVTGDSPNYIDSAAAMVAFISSLCLTVLLYRRSRCCSRVGTLLVTALLVSTAVDRTGRQGFRKLFPLLATLLGDAVVAPLLLAAQHLTWHPDLGSLLCRLALRLALTWEYALCIIRAPMTVVWREARLRTTYLRKFAVFIPILSPISDRRCQVCLLLMALLIAGERTLNVLLLRQLGLVIDQVRAGHQVGSIPWSQVQVYLVIRWLTSAAGLRFARSFAQTPLQQFAYRRIATAAHQHVLTLDADFYAKESSAEVIRAIDQGEALQDLLEFLVVECIPLVLELSVACVFLSILFDAYMSLTLLSTIILCMLVGICTTRLLVTRQRVYKGEWRAMYRTLHEAIANWPIVVDLNGVDAEMARYGRSIMQYHTTQENYFTMFHSVEAIQQLLILLSEVVALSWALHAVTRREVPVGHVVTLLSYWSTVRSHMSSASKFVQRGARLVTDLERLAEVLNTSPIVREIPNARLMEATYGRVEFQAVTFTHPKQQTPTLRDISLSVAAREKIALVGPTGSGKSTLAALLVRSFNVDTGRIRIDSQDISAVTLTSLRATVGWVPQDILLFDESILYNVRYGRPNASLEEVKAACHAAVFHDKVQSLPEGYETVVGVGGARLSRGEKQRLAIARMLLTNAQVVILDEATSALDAETEALVEERLQTWLSEKTVITISHQLSATKEADAIFVMENGRIIGRGKHDILLAECEKYSSLWSAQQLLKRS